MDLLTYTEHFLQYIKEYLILRVIFLIIILMVLSFVINRSIDWFFRKSHLLEDEVEQTIQGVIRSGLKYTSVTIVIIYLIGQFMNLKGLLAGAGIIGVIVGLAAQEVLKDILLGLVRLSDREFRVGNYITFNGNNSGTIEEIGIRFMQVREWSGKLLTIPHGEVRTIQNFNKGKMRVIERMTVSYQEDPEKMKQLMEQVCKICNEKYFQCLLKLDDGRPEQEFQFIGITDLNPNIKYVGYELCLVGLVWPDDYFEVSRKVRFELLKIFHENQIHMPGMVLYNEQMLNQNIPDRV
ncbi:mechanosensitive ion channel family protein [Neobacillus cucumis]|uniref:mechanosensitive ion channel family protein n=1 Tax=Neobacillus cucumis TaxID=1740721 RepID=UPI001965E3E2|nr:mechanosensitive ion channel family protein [Neobacillus cucumis]MBM7651015.1 small-conductance mechanosensitive channel [Neobacillus cucumis]MED4223950.1 mechanosensitive ion channel family protein [Neobacillus cucumis]